MPKVSIVIPSYNHEKFIGECVQSALEQTFQDFEVVVTDDGSTDGTAAAIKGIRDPRVKLNIFEKNRGACAALNDCIRRSAGRYIAVLNSDDAWEKVKLEKQVTFLDGHPEIGAVFTWVSYIDEKGKRVSPRGYRKHLFDKENRSRYEWLNYFFTQDNCLCHPSLLVRRQCYDDVGLYDERMASVPDLDMWVRLCLRFDLHIMPEELVRFRIRRGEMSESGPTLRNLIRNRFEYIQVLNHYLEIKDAATLLRVFPAAGKYGKVEDGLILYFLARLALDTGQRNRQLWGLGVLFELLKEPATAAKLERDCGFSLADFHKVTAKYDVFNLRGGWGKAVDAARRTLRP